MAAERVNSGVQSGKRGTSSNLIVPPIKSDKIVHLFTNTADFLGHAVGTAGQVGSSAHIGKDLGGVGLVIARHGRAAESLRGGRK